MKKYIRFGPIPTNEQSVKLDGSLEDGVSVYDTVLMTNGYHPIIPIPPTLSQGITYMYLIKQRRDVYIVIGDEVGYGSDGEPLIRNVKIISNITEKFYDTH